MQRPSPRNRILNRDPLNPKVSTQVANWLNVVNPLDYKPSLWLDASDTTTITESSGSVSQWNDKSGNDFHVSQGTSANQPVTGTRTINGLNVLDFNVGTSNVLTRATASQLVDSATGGFTAFAVWQADTTSGIGGVISQDASSGTRMPQMIRRDTTNVQTVRVAGGVFVDNAGVTVTTATTFVTASQHRINDIEAWGNGSSNGATATTGSNGTIAALIRVGAASATASAFFDGVIAEIIVIPRNLTNLEMNSIGNYLVRKWAGTWAVS